MKTSKKDLCAGVLICVITIEIVSSNKEFEPHSQDFFKQDQVQNTMAASGTYGGKVIGGEWLIKDLHGKLPQIRYV